MNMIVDLDYSEDEGKRLLKLAHDSINSFYTNKLIEFPEGKKFRQLRGVFITLINKTDNNLRGCIGFPYPNHDISQSIVEAAREAAFNDPRFSRVKENELDNISVEISILTHPQDCSINEFEVGKDGLICEYLSYSSLLLPQVAVDNNLDKIKFLEALCEKAGMHKDAWQQKHFNLKKFQAKIKKRRYKDIRNYIGTN